MKTFPDPNQVVLVPCHSIQPTEMKRCNINKKSSLNMKKHVLPTFIICVYHPCTKTQIFHFNFFFSHQYAQISKTFMYGHA